MEIKNLQVKLADPKSTSILRGVDLALAQEKVHGLVGASGSGKTTVCYSILRLMENYLYEGEILFENKNLLNMPEPEIRGLRGRKISMIFQDPKASFNPYMKIGPQVGESLRAHDLASKKETKDIVLSLMDEVGITNPSQRYKDYPRAFSGGELQRLMIASAISCKPKLILADEPTTALDVNLQHRIFDLLLNLKDKYKLSLLLISHDFPMVASYCEETHFMEMGQIIESNPTQSILENPQTPLSQSLVEKLKGKSLPKTSASDLSKKTNKRKVVEIRELSFCVKEESPLMFSKGSIKTILDKVSLDVLEGDFFGIVGPSGSGKSTLAHLIMRLLPATSGEVLLFEKDILGMNPKDLRSFRKNFQIVFQNSGSSLNPKRKISEILSQPLEIHFKELSKEERGLRVEELMIQMSLDASILERYPHQISGGQQQRVCIARALACDPQLLVFDESLRSLDFSVQEDILELLLKIKKQKNLTYIFISHDLKLILNKANRLAVMDSGEVAELGETSQLVGAPKSRVLQEFLSFEKLI